MNTAHAHALLPFFLLSLGLTACGDKEVEPDDDDDETPWVIAACDGATAISGKDGQPTGYVQCADGSVDRPQATTMDASHDLDSCAGTEDELGCTTDAECTAGPNGTCSSSTDTDYWDTGGPITRCSCVYSCASDADCDSGEACLPAVASLTSADHNTCVQASCSTDADCGTDGACGVSAYHDGCSWDRQLTCRTSEDACRANSDCAGNGDYCSVATWAESEAWTCNNQNCDIGRPLLVAERPRTAPTLPGTEGWAKTRDAHTRDDTVNTELSASQRSRLSAYWGRVAAMEHASVASFARFSLQLMALGAPAELLRESQQAGLDEIRHAELTYGLASRFAGEARGPGALDLGGVTFQTDAESVLRALVAEACVGETLGVAEAHAALLACEDTEVRAALEEILADEQRHAALAWKTLRWMVQTRPELATIALDAAQQALSSLTRDVSAEPGLPAFGLLSGEARATARVDAAQGLVLPLLRGVLTTAGTRLGPSAHA